MVLPNYRYTLNITIQGSASAAAGGEITSYSVCPFFSSADPQKNLDEWIDGQEKIDFDYEEK